MSRFVGVDPGPIPGIVVLHTDGPRLARADVYQCSHEIAPGLLGALLGGALDLVQIEQFVVSARAGRSVTASAGGVTRELIGRLAEICDEHGVRHVERPAGHVKPWATDTRLEAAGLLEATKGMRHARDAARHALFLAVKDGGLSDPLSKEFTR